MNPSDKERRSDKTMPAEETDVPCEWEPLEAAGLAGTDRQLSRG
ncbi:MAG: hypothetical protein U1F76_02905 [Candidatus Competibacteraceae bacterium]